jgi:hypothetical protein
MFASLFGYTRVGGLHTFKLGRIRVKLWRVGPQPAYIPGDRVFSPVPRHALEQ